jgi:hypothetical protein
MNLKTSFYYSVIAEVVFPLKGLFVRLPSMGSDCLSGIGYKPEGIPKNSKDVGVDQEESK